MKRKGFTLIELLVVIAIIGLLSTLAVVALTGARAKARDARRLSDIKQIQTALDLFYSDQSVYPTFSGVDTYIAGAFTFGKPFKNEEETVTYMGLVPTNPAPTGDGNCGSHVYTYAPLTDLTSYTIKYCLGGKVGDVDPDTHYATPAGIADP